MKGQNKIVQESLENKILEVSPLSSKLYFGFMVFIISLGGFVYLSIYCVYNTMWDHIPKIYGWEEKELNYLMGLTNSLLSFGQLLACLFNGFLMQRYGRRISLIIGHLVCIIGSLCTFTIINTPFMMFGRFTQGISQGIIITSMPLLSIQISPNRYRGIVGGIQSTFFSLGLIVSFLISLGQNEYNANIQNDYWRFVLSLPFFVSALAFLGLVLFIRQDSLTFTYQKYKDNEEKLMQLYQKYLTKEEISQQIEKLKEIEIEQKNVEKLSLSDLFSRKYQKRILIGLMFFLTPHLNGIDILNIYSSEIINKYDTRFISNIFSTLISIADLISCLLSILIVNKFGRKQLYIAGQLFLCLTIVIYLALSYNECKSYLKYILVLYKFTYGMFLANILILYSSEILPSVGISLVNMAALIIQLSISQTFPFLIASFLKFEGIFLIFCIISFLFVLIAKIFMKETKNVSIQDIPKLYD